MVTGASRGIGRACALELAKAGRKGGAGGPSGRQTGGGGRRNPGGRRGGFRRPDGPEFARFHQRSLRARDRDFGPVSILVNNAAVTRDGLALRMKPADWDSVIQTNLSGTFFCIQQVLSPMMRERWGRIVNVSSVVGESGNAGQANYVASKAGVIGLTKALAQEMASRRITVNAVAPGFIDTDMTAVLKDEVKAAVLANIPLKRFGRPEDIAAAVRFLCSEEAGYITGHVLDVNGGMYMR